MMLMVTFVFVADESCSAEAAEDEALSAEKHSVDNSCKTTVAAKKHTRKHRKRRRKAGMIQMTSCFVFCLCEFLLFSDVCMCKIVELFLSVRMVTTDLLTMVTIWIFTRSLVS